MKTTPDAVDEIRYTSHPLPRTCTPLPGETIDSYLDRLASANLMEPEYLRILAAGDRHKAALPRPAVLARLSGHTEHTLVRALPELTPPARAPARGRQLSWSIGPGCQLCNSSRGAGKSASVWHAPEDVLCRRHHRWTTGIDYFYTEQQPNLADQPEILAAHRAYRRLARVHGREAARGAYLRAMRILDEWWDGGSYKFSRNDGFTGRMTKFLGPDWTFVLLDSPLVAAARYPQVVALARLLASPYWMDLALRDHITAGRPDPEQRRLVAKQLLEYRRTTFITTGRFADPSTPDHFVADLAATYLLADAPGLRIFLAELRRTVEPRYRWNPYPTNSLRKDLEGAGRFDPLVDLISDRVQAERAKLAS